MALIGLLTPTAPTSQSRVYMMEPASNQPPTPDNIELHEPMLPHPFFHTRRQASQHSLDDNDTNIQHSNEINVTHGIRRSNSLDSLLGQSGGRDEGRSRNSQNCGKIALAIDDIQNNAAGASVFCQQCHISPWPSCAGQTVDDIDVNASALGDFHCVEALLVNQEIIMPLRQWIANDTQERSASSDRYEVRLQKASTLRKVTISYAIAKLLQHLSLHFQINEYSPGELERLCSIDNFVIQLSNEQSDLGWEVMGVDMVNPQLQLKIITSYNFFDLGNDEEFTGRKVTADISSPDENSDHVADALKTNDEITLCYLLGMILHGLFAEEDVDEIKRHGLPKDDRSYEGMPSAKKRSTQNLPPVRGSDFPLASSDLGSYCKSYKSRGEGQVVAPFSTSIGYSSLSQVVTNLVKCGSSLVPSSDSYSCLEEAIVDLCLLLEEPGRFLFGDFQALPKGERAISIGKGSDRLYGRTAEAHLITDTFCRVVSTGESEAILIGGFSGCGKTRLAQSVFEAVEAIGGFVIVQKFDAVSTLSPSSIVLSTFNELCLMFSKKSTPQELDAIYQGLINEFGANFHVLARALPNVLVMLSCCASLPISKHDTDTLNLAGYSSLCFTLQRFMRVVSSTSRPIMLFLDDLQWADPVSLGLVHAVLSDMKGKSCMLFVGTYRDNEVAPDNIIFSFVNMLSQFNVLTSKIHLDGLTEKDVNFMVSDALGALPRLCRSLSHLVYRKTNGSPYFVLEFLRSLVDRDVVQFSLREKRWIWDDAKVCAENITDNVLYLLSNKLNSLSECMQTALKCASCFGIKMDKTIAQQLSGYSKHHNLQSALDDVVKGGFMDYDGAYYRFVHDKVREAAYDLIKPDRRDHYHFELGMAIYSCCVNKDNMDALFATVEQINHGVPSLVRGTAHENVVAELNYKASCEMMRCSNFTSALDYIRAAVSLLADDSWTVQYAISLKYHLQLGKAAFPCGSIDETKSALNKVIEFGKCLDDKIDAYFLLVAMQSCGAPSLEEIGICVQVLRLLGEDLPKEDLELCEIISAVNVTKEMFERESDEELLQMTNAHNGTKRIENIMKFYGQLGLISWIAAPKMHAFYMARFAQFCLKSKVDGKYLPSAFVAFGACLCNVLANETLVGYRIGKIGLLLLNRSESDMDEASKVYLAYYYELVSSPCAENILRCIVFSFFLVTPSICDCFVIEGCIV
eukprot:CCRYP_021112-RB/>CCRYP_021112-RB protein AED:0.02 eAED:0.02 QI:21/1/1/1/1/1/4/1110/1196